MFKETVLDALAEAGATVKPIVAEGVPGDLPDLLIDVQVGGKKRRFAVEAKQRAPYPSEAERLDALRDRLIRWGSPLLHLPEVTHGQARALTNHGWSWVDDQGNFDLRTTDFILRNREARPRRHGRRASAPFPYGWAGLRVLRTLITQPSDGLRTTIVSKRAEVSAARTSQVLHQLRDHDFASKREDGSWAVDRASLLDLFLAEYPGPGGDARHFYALDIGVAMEEIATSWEQLGVAVSGDVAADVLVPYRRPSHVVVYLEHGSIAEADSLVSTSNTNEANITVVRPFDTSVFPVGPLEDTFNDGIRLADPTQVAWDLQHLGGTDRLQHLDLLRSWILRSL